MKSITTGELYAERCQQAENGNVMAQLEVTAHRICVFTRDLLEAVRDADRDRDDDRLQHALNRATDLYVHLNGVESGGPDGIVTQPTDYDPAVALGMCGLLANHLHASLEGEWRDPEDLIEMIEIWEKLCHVQYLIGTVYPIYINVLKEARLMARGGLEQYSQQMQAQARDVLNINTIAVIERA